VHAHDTADAADPERHARHDRAVDGADLAPATLAGVRSAPTVARMPTKRVLSLQRRAGNRAVAALVQRNVLPPMAQSDDELVKEAIADRDVAKIKRVKNLAKAGGPYAFQLIDILTDQFWAGPADEQALEILWGGFGDKILDRAKDRPDLWEKSLKKGAELYELPVAKQLADKFVVDVRGIATRYLDSNERYCTDELKRLGVGEGGGETKPGEAGAPSAEDQATRQAELMAAIRITKEAKLVQDQLRTVPVGLERRLFLLTNRTLYFPVAFNPSAEPDPTDANPPPDRIEKARAAGLSEEALQRVPWKEVKAQWDVLDAIMQGLSIAYPIAGIGLMRGDRAMGEAVQDDPKAAKAAIVAMLTSTRDSIRETRPKLAGSLAYELVPIHNQLFGGTKGGSNTDWKSPVAQALAKEVLELKSDVAFWKSMGLATLAAAAFILAEFATAGMATAALIGFGVGLGAGQAIVAWEKALEMQTAEKATTGAGTELLASGQASMATFEAALATVMVFADALTAAKPLGRALSGAVDKAALKAGTKAAKAITEELAALAGKAPDKALVERAVTELGAEQVMAQTGKNAADLLAIVGEGSPIAARLRTLGSIPSDLLKLTPAELAKRAGNLSTEVSANPATGEALAALAVERLGPKRVVEMNGGWKALSLTLGNDSAAGKAIMAWRDGMIGDIEAFVKTLPGGIDKEGQVAVKRTGSQGKFTNDFDVSLLGPHASKNRAALRSFVAGRVGTSPDRLGELLLADFFTDPRRLHLYDQLDPALRAEVGARAEKVAESTIMAKTLHDAEQAGNKELAERIRAQMKELGIEEVPFKPLGEADRTALYGKIDDYHQQLENAIAAGDKAAQKDLVGKIGDTQGLINATEGGGYFSGGATRQIVTLAEGLLKGGAKPLDQQVYTALLDQLPKLNSEASALLKTGFVATEDAVGAIKGIAKYGARFRQLMKDLGVSAVDDAAWDALAGELTKILKQAKGEADVTLLSRLQTDAAKLESDVAGLLGQFRSASQEVLMTLSRQAAMGSVKVDLGAIQFLVMATAKLTRAGAAVRQSLRAISLQIAEAAAAAAKRQEQEDQAAKGTATPPGGTPAPTPAP
jgi:hypothetical protein